MDSGTMQQPNQLVAQTTPLMPQSVGMERMNKDAADFQKHIISAEGFRRIFYSRIAGYRMEYEPDISKLKSGESITRFVPHWRAPKDTEKTLRVGNDEYAEYVYTDVYPLISAQMATSKQSKYEIHDKWHTKLIALYLESERMWLFRNNQYEIDIDRLPNLMAFLGGMSGMSSKSLEGWAFEKMSTSDATQRIIHEGLYAPQQQSSGGMLGGLRSAIGKVF